MNYGDDFHEKHAYLMDVENGSENELEQNMVTMYADSYGNLIFNVFSIDQWNMIDDIVELTGKERFEIIQGLSEDDSIKTWTIDPKEFPNEIPEF